MGRDDRAAAFRRRPADLLCLPRPALANVLTLRNQQLDTTIVSYLLATRRCASMLARRDQENFVHAQQTAAAAKPLNQSVRGLAPKTPGNGRKGNKNDENAITLQSKKDGNAFVTPGPNRDRIALGAKTTNAKARALATPGPLTGGQGLQKTQRRSGSTKKPKLKVHHQPELAEAAPVAAELSDEEPDVEYCPPPIKELPDGPDEFEFGPDKTFPQFEGDNYFRGWHGIYMNPVGPDGMTRYERQAKEQEEAIDRHIEESAQRDVDESWERMNRDLDDLKLYEAQKKSAGSRSASVLSRASSSVTSRPLSSAASSRRALIPVRGPSSTEQKKAAAALSGKHVPRFAQPTAATQAKNTTPAPIMPASPASKATIGYARGRQVSSSIKEVKARDLSSRTHERRLEDSPLVQEQLLLEELLQSVDTRGGMDEDLWEGSGKDWFQEQLDADKDIQLEIPDYD
ncbi:hypothetical protein FH972_021407 [Carpinus fangiana]|uniref:Uncharacterized protein n=1 Tax=Carpinus fangiana TaxID=176857 RepID=A0A5N6KPL6_9ROSI|nr:hypothetical protein FH972_021407 [Carpinus fangiana]